MFLIDKRSRLTGEWTDSSAIYDRAVQIWGSEELAEKALDETLTNNAWDARAAVGIVGPDYGEVPTSAPREIGPFCYERFALNRQPVRILPAFWRGSRSIVPGRLWNWQQGIFAHAASAQVGLVQWEGDDRWFVEVPKRWVAFDVQFNAQKASDYLDKLARHVDEKRGSTRAKPRKKKWPWATALAELESRVEHGDMSQFGSSDDYGAQARIVKFIRERIVRETGEEPPESTTKLKAKAIMDLWHRSGA